MWNRKELKQRAKTAFKRNYVLCVVVALLLGIIAGSGTTYTAQSTGRDVIQEIGSLTSSQPTVSENGMVMNGDKVTVEATPDGSVIVNGKKLTKDEVPEFLHDELAQMAKDSNMTEEEFLGALLLVFSIVGGALALAVLVGIVLKIFVWNLFEIGGCRFFTVNADEKAGFKELFRGFSSGYGRNVFAMLLRNIYLALWSLLFVIPGIIKSYSYYLLPYILADSPEMSQSEAFALSRQLMNGNKWKAFVLELSFIGWYILNIFTLGLLGLFYINPYVRATKAEFYKALRYPQA